MTRYNFELGRPQFHLKSAKAGIERLSSYPLPRLFLWKDVVFVLEVGSLITVELETWRRLRPKHYLLPFSGDENFSEGSDSDDEHSLRGPKFLLGDEQFVLIVMATGFRVLCFDKHVRLPFSRDPRVQSIPRQEDFSVPHDFDRK